MKILSRDFNRGEKALLIFLAIVLLALCYYLVVYRPVHEGIETAHIERDNLFAELQVAQARVAVLERMQNEIDNIMSDPNVSMMPSYNNKKAVNSQINDILNNMSFSATLSNLTRSGDQIRRNIQLQFTAPSYAEMERVLNSLCSCPYRCLVNNVNCSRAYDRYYDTNVYNVSLTATFFETLVGGTPDAALPADPAA